MRERASIRQNAFCAGRFAAAFRQTQRQLSRCPPRGRGPSPWDGVEGFGTADSGIYHFCGGAAFAAPDPLGLGHPRQRIVRYEGVCLIPGVAALTTPDPLGLGHLRQRIVRYEGVCLIPGIAALAAPDPLGIGHLRQRIVRYEGVCLIPGGAAPPLNKTSA